MHRRPPILASVRATLLASALLLLPAALSAGVASAQTQPDTTVYHSLDPAGADPRPEYPPGCTAGSAPGGGGGGDSGYDSGFDSGGGSSGPGGWVIVVADVNAGNNPTFYTNLLEGGTQVLAGRGLTFYNNPVIVHYQLLPGVTTTVTNTTIDAAALAGKDLLIVNQPDFDQPLVYTPAELTAIGDFVAGGGNVLLFAETDQHRANFNAFLSGIGSAIQYSLESRSGSGALVVSGAPFTTGVTSFSQAAFDLLTGGESIVTETEGLFRTYVAAERVSGGGGAPMADCVLGGESYEELSVWIDGGPTASGVEEQLCNRGEDGGSGNELCGATLTFQLSGIGRFRKVIADPAMDTLVLGEECLPTEGLGCILQTEPPVTLLQMNFLRGANPLVAGPRRIGSLIVDSTGLDPAVNFTAITVFGEAAGALLQLRPIASGVAPEVLADSRLIPVPEPGQLVQLVSGLFGLAGLHRLRRRH